MPTAVDSSPVIVGLNLDPAMNVYLEPALRYENPMQNALGLFKIITRVKDKVKMTHLDTPENVLQPKSNCKTWNPNLSIPYRTDDLTVCSFEMMGEQCADDFDNGCLRNLQGAGNMVNDMNGTQELTELQAAALLLYRDAIINDLYQIVWFGNADFNTPDDPWAPNLSHMDVDNRVKMENKLRHCQGFWVEILERNALDPNEPGYVRAVDTNNGTVAGNATLPANIVAFLQTMIDRSHITLRYWKRSKPNAQRPVFMLQSRLYSAYLTYLMTTGTEQSQMLLVNGTPVEGIYMYKGYPVVETAEWDMYDVKTGAEGKNERAIFTALENLTIGIDVASLAEYQNSAIVVWKSPDIRDKGLVVYYAAFRLGMRVAYPNLITVGFNSSEVFVAA